MGPGFESQRDHKVNLKFIVVYYIKRKTQFSLFYLHFYKVKICLQSQMAESYGVAKMHFCTATIVNV